MPTYIYRREDGTTFEIDQRITEDALTTCPTTDQPVTRVITGGTGLIFKGSGFYLTDYARGNGNTKKNDTKSSKSTETPASSDSSTVSPESTPSEKSVASKSDDG